MRPSAFVCTLVTLVVLTFLALPRARAADLFVSSADTNSIVRYDGRTGALKGVFVPPGSGGLAGTHQLVFGPDGNLYVNNRYGHNILRYDGRTGAFLGVFVPAGSGGLDTNIALLFGPDGHLYASCYFTHRVLRFHGTTGRFINTFIAPGSGGLSHPGGMLFGPDGNLYVSSSGNHQVLCYSGQTGAFLRAFVSERDGGLQGPIGLAFGPDGRFYVSSEHTDSVLRYDGRSGAFLGAFVPPGSGGLDGPSGLRFGPDGHLYVVSQYSQMVLRYDGQTGALLGSFASGELARPTWIAFSPPEAPTGLTVSPVGSVMRLTWSDNSDDEWGFEIERQVSPGAFTLIGRVGPNVTSFFDPGHVPGTPNLYRVRAVGALGPSIYSNAGEATLFFGGTLWVERSLVLPRTAVGGTSAQTLFIYNIGSGVLSGNVETPPSPFSLFSGGGRFVLAPGQRLPVVVGFSPFATGTAVGTLLITSSDLQQPAVLVRLDGEGTP